MTDEPAPLVYAPPIEPWLTVLHLDRDLVAIDKPSGLFSVPGREPAHQDSAYTRVLAAHPFARIVHRLDLSTSGVLLFALRRKAEAALRAQFQAHTVQKRYVARLVGVLAADSGEVSLALEPDVDHLPRQRVSDTGKTALTRWTVLDRSAESTLVELRPVTGRTHQLRVHMAALGHPILGDALYAPLAVRAMAPRLLLHAQRIEVVHPYSGEVLGIEAGVPGGF